MPLRKPTLHGQYYTAEFDGLNKEIEECFHHPQGPGDLPVRRSSTRRVLSVIVPHARLDLSGPCAAWAFKELAETRFPSTFVILGSNHSGLGGPASVMLDPWQTPLGTVRTDKSLCLNLMGLDFVRQDYSPFVQEASIEAVLPLLQYASRDKLDDLSFVPVVMQMNTFEQCRKLAEKIATADERCMVIASSDFTHYGLDYSYVPFAHNRRQGMHQLDGKAIDFLLNLDAEGFLGYCEKTKTNICGIGPLVTAIEFVKLMDGKKGRLLHYYTSGDITGNDRSSVGFATLNFESLD